MSESVILFKDLGDGLGFKEGWRMGQLWADLKRGKRDIEVVLSIDEARFFKQMGSRLNFCFDVEPIKVYGGETKVKIKVLAKDSRSGSNGA